MNAECRACAEIERLQDETHIENYIREGDLENRAKPVPYALNVVPPLAPLPQIGFDFLGLFVGFARPTKLTRANTKPSAAIFSQCSANHRSRIRSITTIPSRQIEPLAALMQRF